MTDDLQTILAHAITGEPVVFKYKGVNLKVTVA